MEKPRYDPNWQHEGSEKFIGHAGELDVWRQEKSDGTIAVYAVGQNKGAGGYNFEGFWFEDGLLVPIASEEDVMDIIPTPHQMCLIYQVFMRSA